MHQQNDSYANFEVQSNKSRWIINQLILKFCKKGSTVNKIKQEKGTFPLFLGESPFHSKFYLSTLK